MMRDHEGDIRGFIQLSRAWYGDANLVNSKDVVDEVTFGYYSPEGGTSGEMSVKWVILSGSTPAAKLVCFYDGFSALSRFTDVIARLAQFDDDGMAPEQFCAVLAACGFADQTVSESPYAIVTPNVTCPTCGTEGVTIPSERK
jgi:hypothetical protein